jgi:hypothetical protein
MKKRGEGVLLKGQFSSTIGTCRECGFVGDVYYKMFYDKEPEGTRVNIGTSCLSCLEKPNG